MARLGDVCNILNGYAFKSEQYVPSGVRVIRIANVQKGYIEDVQPVFYPTDCEEVKKYALEANDLLMSLTGNVGRVSLISSEFLPAALNQRVACLRVKDSRVLDKTYLYHFLNSDFFEQKCIAASQGVAQKNMSTEWLKKYEIPLLALATQQRIARILSRCETLISLRKQQIAKLDELVKARFVEMFGDETQFHKWECCCVGDVADVCVGVVIKPTQYYADQGIPAFRSLNIGELYVKDNDWVYFTEEGHAKNQKSVIRENDVLVVRSGAPGTACVATKHYAGYNAIDIIIAHPDCGKVDSVFLATFTNMPHGMNQIREKTGGAAQQHFNVGGYKALTLILPPLDLQHQFAAFVAQTDQQKSTIQHSLAQLELLKKALMQKYFG